MATSGNVICYAPQIVGVLNGIGKALAVLRERAGFKSQEALAKKLGLTQGTIGKREAATANLRISTLDEHLTALGFDLHDLAYAIDGVQGREPKEREATPAVQELYATIGKMSIRADVMAEMLHERDDLIQALQAELEKMKQE